jgi:hypothetical protein
MRKLALCFSGDPRTFKDCFENIQKNILDNFDCDVFISTYEVDDEISNTILNLYKPTNYIFRDKNNVNKEVSEYINKLKSIKILPCIPNNFNTHFFKDKYDLEDMFFDYDTFKNNFIYKQIDLNSMCQFFGINDVSKLCQDYILQNNINYDYILRLRLDSRITGSFKINELEENEILVNFIHSYSNSLKPDDHFYMAKPQTFFKISDLYSNLPNIIEFINENKCWLPRCGYQETLLLIQIMLQNIKFKSSSSKFLIKKYT